MCDDIQNCCRLCLDVESSHVSIFGDPTISVHLRSCLGITVFPNDQLPTDICMSCVSQLSQFYHFQINARCSQDWLESSFQQKFKKSAENKTPIQPLPDSEYNSDSLLEFLNNTANIEEYLNNLGKDDIPSIMNMLDKNEHVIEASKLTSFKCIKQPSPKKKEVKSKTGKLKMEIDVLDSDVEIVKEIILKESEPKIKQQHQKNSFNFSTCYGCKLKFESVQKLLQHVSTCDNASRTCTQCDQLFDSRQKMIEHSVIHNSMPFTCHCEEKFQSKDRFIQHQKTCHADHTVSIGCLYRCKECGNTFKDRFQLYKHAKLHIIKAEEKKCDICGHIFMGSDALLKHKKKEHDSNNTMYRCKICNITSSDHQEMYLHVKTHTGNLVSTRHLCETCGKSFSTKAVLQRHSSQHNKPHHKTDMKQGDTAMCERCGQTISCSQFNVHNCG